MTTRLVPGGRRACAGLCLALLLGTPAPLGALPPESALPPWTPPAASASESTGVWVEPVEPSPTPAAGIAGRRVFRLGLLALGAGAAALGLRTKDRADRAYEEYLHTGNLRKMQDAFERAETYDRYALGCWVVAEASLLGFLYLLTHAPARNTWELSSHVDPDEGSTEVRVRWSF